MDYESQVRIVVADDHPLFRDGVRRFLETERGLLVVGLAADGQEALEQCARLHPDVLLLDVCMPRVSGLEALARLRDESPTTAAILLTAGIDRRGTLEAVMLGARGLVLKTAESDVLVRCVREVASGGYWIDHSAINDLVTALRTHEGREEPAAEGPVVLTRRERQIVSAVIRGASNADISRSFGLRDQTVKNHLTRIFDKTGVSTRLELALYAIGHGIGEASDDDEDERPPAYVSPATLLPRL